MKLETYHFQITAAELFISSGVLPAWHGAGKPPDVYDETIHLELAGQVMHPPIIAGRPLSLSIYGGNELQTELAKLPEKRTKSGGIGFVDFWGKNQAACVWLSVSAVNSVYELAGRRNTLDVVLTGDELKRRRAAIRHFFVGSKFEQEDWYD